MPKDGQSTPIESAQDYAELLKLGPDAVFINDLSGAFLEVNPATCERLGYKPAELLGKGLGAIHRPGDAGAAVARLEEIFRRGAGMFETVHVAADGREIPVEVSSRLVDREGSPAVLSIARDITDRKAADEALRRRADEASSLNRLAGAVAESLDLEHVSRRALEETVRIAEPDLAILFVVEGGRLRLIGSHPESPATAAIGGKVHRVGQCLCGGAAGGEPVYVQDIRADARCVLPECKEAGMHSFAALPLSHGGTVVGVLGLASRTARDFTASREFLETLASQVALAMHNAMLHEQLQDHADELEARLAQLRSTEERLRFVETSIERAGDAAYWMDAGGRLVYVNPAACEALGYERSELLSMTIHDIDPQFPPEDWPAQWAQLREKGTGTTQTVHRRRDGTTFPVEINANHIEFGGKAYNCAFARDITEREHLADQLRQAQKMEAIGRLAGGIAHDFNNQLTVVKGYCDLLLAEMDADAPLRGEIEEIHGAAVRAQRLTGGLLTFSRRQVLSPEVTNLNDVLRDTANPMGRMIGEDIELAIVEERRLGSVEVDRSQFTQAVMNLAVNARDAMPDGGKLTIETANVELDDSYSRRHPESSAGPHVMVAVSDTGTGMDAATLERIFEPFFTTKQAGEGTGLGLSMVYGFVKQSGGTVYVYSEPGHGTTVKIYLPRVDVSPSPEEAEEGARPAAPGTDAGERVLVVEDDDAVRRLIARALRERGYAVLEAETADRAEQLADGADGAVDLLVTDVVLPARNGPSLARQLRAAHPGMRVLYVSGYTQGTAVRHGMVEGGSPLLSKPFRPEELARAVREVLDAPH